MKRLKKWQMKVIVIILCITLFIGGSYAVVVYSNIPFIKKYRTLWIETAMGTMTHQWLATAFFPDYMIKEVMSDVNQHWINNMVESSLIPNEEDRPDKITNLGGHKSEIVKDPKFELVRLFYELDISTLPDNLNYKNLQISDIEDLGIKTTAGDSVYAIDVPNKILIITVTGNGYKGKLAIIRDSSQVVLAVNSNPYRGESVTELCNDYGAVLGINANGFLDTDGMGTGFYAQGLIISKGEKFNEMTGGQYQIAGYDYEDNFRVGYGVNISELRDAMQFYPILILNGENIADGSYGMGIQPRTVIGQTMDKSTLMLIVDGRQAHSIGITVSECADIMLRYDCYNAMNMDGGSSSSMTYMGEMITKVSTSMKGGRTLPSAWVVLPAESIKEN